MAIDDARDGIYNGDGGPFGCVIVKDDQVIGHGHNRVVANTDSTCHGEMEGIRNRELFDEEKASIGRKIATVEIDFDLLIAFKRKGV